MADAEPSMSKYSSQPTIFFIEDIEAIVNQVLSYIGSPSLPTLFITPGNFSWIINLCLL